MRVVAPALTDAQHLHTALGQLDRGAQACGPRADHQYGGSGAPLVGLSQRARGRQRLHCGEHGELALDRSLCARRTVDLLTSEVGARLFLLLRVIIGSYAAGSIRVVMAIRFQALITVIAHIS
jgi:hypothetical protein